jgi:hypothetical protein
MTVDKQTGVVVWKLLDENDIGELNDSLVGSQISLRERYANEKRGIDC